MLVLVFFSLNANFAFGQFYINGGLKLAATNTFTLQNGKNFESNTTSIVNTSLLYLLERKEKNNYLTHGFEIGVEMFSLVGTQNGVELAIDFVGLNLSSTSYLPRYTSVNKEGNPLFDIIFGLGYGLTKPVSSTFKFSEYDLSYIQHALNVKLGAVFYTDVDSYIEISVFSDGTLVSQKLKNYDNSLTPLLFQKQGISFKIGGNIDNLGKALKAIKKRSK